MKKSDSFISDMLLVESLSRHSYFRQQAQLIVEINNKISKIQIAFNLSPEEIGKLNQKIKHYLMTSTHSMYHIPPLLDTIYELAMRGFIDKRTIIE